LFGVVDLGRVRMGMLIVSSLFSTIIVGVLSSAVSIFLGLIPYNVFIVSMIMFAGVIQGIAGGVLSFYLFEKHIRRLIATYLA
jgi:5-bromo-4-chloroindolyl phosphate hydrolysis protein